MASEMAHFSWACSHSGVSQQKYDDDDDGDDDGDDDDNQMGMYDSYLLFFNPKSQNHDLCSQHRVYIYIYT
jgi:hypothetical protein